MTIAALLRHHGISVPRYVTVDGQIVFDDVTPASTPTGFTHSALGAVTPVANHTFHGGDEEPDDGPETPAVWWEDESRLHRHLEAMERSFPNFVYLPAEDGYGPCWGGTINTGRGRFDVGIFPRRDEGLPSVAVFDLQLGAHAGRRWIRSPHLYLNGNLCVADRHDWHPNEHTVATVAAWAAHWLAAYTEWRMTRRWPAAGTQVVAA